MTPPEDLSKKICMVGAYNVGKTSLVQRFVKSEFDEKYQTTVGVKVDKKVVMLKGQKITLMLWDLAGQDTATQVRMSHLRGASAYILVVDGTRAETLSIAKDLQIKVVEAIGSVPFVLVVNKCDLKPRWEIRQEELLAYGWRVFLSSAKTGEAVEEFFLATAESTL